MNKQDTFDLRDMASLLRRQIRLIGITLIVVLAIAFVYLTRATPLYTATALIKIDPQETNLLDPTQARTTNSSVESTKLDTEVEILKSDSLSIQTIQALKLQETPEFGPNLSLLNQFRVTLGFDLPPPPTGTELVNDTLRRFKDALKIRRRGLTYIVAVQVTTPRPEQAAQIANAHAATFIHDQVAGRATSSMASRDVLQSQLTSARARLQQSDETLRGYIEGNVIRLAEESGNPKLAEIGRKLQKSSQQLGQYEQNFQTVRTAVDSQNWEALASNVGDEALTALVQQRKTLEQRLSAAPESSGEALNFAAGLAELEAQLKQRGSVVYNDVETNLQSFQDSRIALLDEAQSAVLKSELSPATLADIYSLQQEASIAQRQYDQLLGRVRDLETQSVLQIANSRIVSKALVPSRPSFPNKRLVLGLALFAGLGFAGGLAFLKEFYLGGVTSASQLENILPVSLGGVVPKVAKTDLAGSPADRISTDPMSPYSESFRKLRASIDDEIAEMGSDKKGKVVVITSAIPAEGKSTTALSLARTYATAGKRTLLIDADLRNPSLHEILGAKPEFGLLEYLLKHSNPPLNPGEQTPVPSEATDNHVDFFVADPFTHAGILLGRKKPNVPTDAPLQSRAFTDILEGARESFDVIIVDTAPLLPVVDTRYVAPLADAVVLCVRYSEARKSEIRNAYEQLVKVTRGRSKILTLLSSFEGPNQSNTYNGYYG